MANGETTTDVVLIYATFPDAATAERICGALVAEHIVACANILAPATSIYIWQGVQQRDTEVPAILKSTRARVAEVIATTTAMHPYDNPAVVALPIADGSRAFLDWVRAQTKPPPEVQP